MCNNVVVASPVVVVDVDVDVDVVVVFVVDEIISKPF